MRAVATREQVLRGANVQRFFKSEATSTGIGTSESSIREAGFQGTSFGMFTRVENGTGTVTVVNGTVTTQAGVGKSTSLSRGGMMGTSYNRERTTSTNSSSYSANSSRGSSRATMFDTTTTVTMGVGDKATTTSVGKGSQMASTTGSGASTTQTKTEGSHTRTSSSGTSGGSMSAHGEGVTQQNSAGTASTLSSRVSQSGTSSGRSSTSTTQTSGETRSRTRSSGSSNSSGTQGFEGTVTTDTENRTARRGTTMQSGRSSSSGSFTVSTSSKHSGGESVSGGSRSSSTFHAQGSVSADHNQVKYSGNYGGTSHSSSRSGGASGGAKMGDVPQDKAAFVGSGGGSWSITTGSWQNSASSSAKTSGSYSYTEDLSPDTDGGFKAVTLNSAAAGKEKVPGTFFFSAEQLALCTYRTSPRPKSRRAGTGRPRRDRRRTVPARRDFVLVNGSGGILSVYLERRYILTPNRDPAIR